MTGLAIFKNKHNYVMTYLYIMTFGPTSARRLPPSPAAVSATLTHDASP